MNSARTNKLNIVVRPIPQSDLQSYPNVTTPDLVGGFSVTTNRFYDKSFDKLRYFMHPPESSFPLDLKRGFQDAIRKPHSTWFEGLDHILSFIKDNQEKVFTSHANGEPRLNTDIVCSRYVLELLMCTPYEYRKDWRLHLTHYNNTVYICHQETAQEEFERREQKDFQTKVQKSWNYKLQQYCMSKSSHEISFVNEPVDECAEFNGVYKVTMDGIRLMYTAEMNGADPNSVNPLDCSKLRFVELKTRLGNMNRNQWKDFNRNEALLWWCQCFLVNIDRVQVGLCNDEGQVLKIETILIRTLRKDSETIWLASACTHFLIRFLRVIKELVAHVNDPTTVFELSFNANTAEITYTIMEGRSQYTLIPDWFRSMMEAYRFNIHTDFSRIPMNADRNSFNL